MKRRAAQSMSEGYDAQLNDAFRAAADRGKIKVFKDLAKQHPAAAAAAVCHSIPLLMRDKRERAYDAYGVDIASQQWKERAKENHHTLAEAGLLLMAANYYLELIS